MKLKSTVDYARIATSLNHEDNAMAIAFRELLHNAQGYGAQNALLFQMKVGSDLFCAMAHDGTPFTCLSEIEEALEFNKSGGQGVQGSGMKTGMYPLSVSIGRSKLIVHSKTPEGEFSCMLSHMQGSETNVAIQDVSTVWNKKLKRFLHGHYEDYGVIYLYRYKNAPNKTVEKSIFNPKNICNFIQLTPSINNDLVIRYNRKFNLENDIYNSKYTITIKKDINDEFKLKEFTFNVNNVKFTSRDEDIINNELAYNATISLTIYPFFQKKNKEKTGNMIIGRNGQPFIVNGINMNDLHQNRVYVHHDYKLSGDNKDRANIDPFYFANTRSSNHLFMNLDVEIPPVHISEINHEIAKEYFNDLDEGVLIEDITKTWRPIIVMNVYIKNVKNIHRDLGSLDNFFCALNREKVRTITKTILDKAAEDNCATLNEFRVCIKDYIPESKVNEYLPVTISTKGIDASDVNVILTESGLEQSKSYVWKKRKPKAAFDILTTVPVNVNGLEVMLEDKNTQDFLNCEITADNEGIIFQKHPHKENIYYLYVSNYYHYSEDDKKTKIYHTEEEHANRKDSRNSYPNKSYKIYANKKTLNVGMTVEVVEKKKWYKDDVNWNFDKKQSKEISSIYKKWDQNLMIFAKFMKGTLYLNKENILLKKLAKKPDNKFKSKFSILYNLMLEYATDLNVNPNSMLNKYSLTGNPLPIEEDYGDVNTLILNEGLSMMLEHNEIARELIDDYEKSLLENNENEESDTITKLMEVLEEQQ